MKLLLKAQALLDSTRGVDFLAPLALRLYLFPIFLMAGWRKLQNPESTIRWFSESLELPLPTLMYWLASLTEFVGAFLLLVGFCTRWISLPLMFTMVIAAYTVHWDKGWYAIGQTQPNPVLMHTAEDAQAIKVRTDQGRQVLRRHGRESWLTEHGPFVILTNGLEFPVTYLIMLLTLFFWGAGRYCSVDHWVRRCYADRASP